MLVCQGPSFYIKVSVNFKTVAFRVMPLIWQLHLVMTSKYSNFSVDTFNTFWVKWGTLKFMHDDDNNNEDLTITIAQLCLRNRQANKSNVDISIHLRMCLQNYGKCMWWREKKYIKKSGAITQKYKVKSYHYCILYSSSEFPVDIWIIIWVNC